jgi:site-specific DNA-methyltransferase (adenine-specific)
MIEISNTIKLNELNNKKTGIIMADYYDTIVDDKTLRTLCKERHIDCKSKRRAGLLKLLRAYDSNAEESSVISSPPENTVISTPVENTIINTDTTYEFILGDCIEELEKLDDNSISVVVTSPPYNIGLKYHKYKDKKPREQYLEWLYDIFTQLKRILKDDGHIFLNMGYTNKDPWISMEVALKLKDLFVMQNKITWVKSISITDKAEDSHGHFKPINSNRYINVTNEDIYHFTKTDDICVNKKAIGVPYKWKCNLKSRSTGEIKEDKRCKGNSWFIPYKTVQDKKEKGYHPATFPEELVEHCIKLTDIKEGVVLDPFIGSGTTIKVAKNLTEKNNEYCLSGIGIDIDDMYINYCNERMN